MNVPSESADLVTMNQGLHHLPQHKVITVYLNLLYNVASTEPII